MSQEEFDRIENFINQDKSLLGLLPEWNDQYQGHFQTRWPICNMDGGTMQSELCFSVDGLLAKPSITCLFEKKMVYRIDVVPEDETKANPHWAEEFGLPPYVTGTHSHPWHPNANYCRENGFGELPCREPLSNDLKRLKHALSQLATDLNITVTAEQRDIDLPSQTSLLQ